MDNCRPGNQRPKSEQCVEIKYSQLFCPFPESCSESSVHPRFNASRSILILGVVRKDFVERLEWYPLSWCTCRLYVNSCGCPPQVPIRWPYISLGCFVFVLTLIGFGTRKCKTREEGHWARSWGRHQRSYTYLPRVGRLWRLRKLAGRAKLLFKSAKPSKTNAFMI